METIIQKHWNLYACFWEQLYSYHLWAFPIEFVKVLETTRKVAVTKFNFKSIA